MDESGKLKWPDGWQRSRIESRKPNGAWKRTLKQSIEALAVELKRHGSTQFEVSYNVAPLDRQDPGVAVYFSKQMEEDYSWQDVLGIESPTPTLAEIETAYRAKVKVNMDNHPDRGGDGQIINTLLQNRAQAIAWVRGTHRTDHEYVIPCDKFTEVRLNVNAVVLLLKAMRQIDRLGLPGVMERSFQGFRASLPAHEMPKAEDSHA